MDLYAYAQIGDLEQIAKDNGIEVPRLRGYRLMKNEEPISIDEIMKGVEIEAVKDLCEAKPFWSANPNSYVYDSKTHFIYDHFLIKEGDEYVGIRWDRIHGKKRKILKSEIKKVKHKIKKQYDMWNKYVGREDVLYIHSRIGGSNWDYFGGNELITKPWFLDKVDDYWDGTYCDIYALIKREV
jgi:hypothetical protein